MSTLLCSALKDFMNSLKAFMKPFDASSSGISTGRVNMYILFGRNGIRRMDVS